ncbi:MAG: DUF1858 domain-containing protein [Clostridia bacterium]
MEKKVYDKDFTIGEVVDADEKNIEILKGFGMHCFGCPMSRMETLEEAAEAHEISLEFLLEKLNEKK